MLVQEEWHFIVCKHIRNYVANVRTYSNAQLQAFHAHSSSN